MSCYSVNKLTVLWCEMIVVLNLKEELSGNCSPHFLYKDNNHKFSYLQSLCFQN